MINTPVIQLRLREMENELVGYFAVHQEQIEHEVKTAVALAVKNFNFQNEVRTQANRAIQEAVNRAVGNYFSYGEGGKLIDKMVTDVLSQSQPIRDRDR